MRRGTKAGEVQCLVAEGGNGEGLRRWGCQAGSIDQLERTRGEIAGESGAIGGLGRPPGQMNWSEMGARRGAAPGRAPPQRRLPGMVVGLSVRHFLPRSTRACKLHGKHARADADAGSAFAQPAPLAQPACWMSSADRPTTIPGSRRWGGALPGAAPRRAPISDQFICPGGLPRPPMAPLSPAISPLVRSSWSMEPAWHPQRRNPSPFPPSATRHCTSPAFVPRRIRRSRAPPRRRIGRSAVGTPHRVPVERARCGGQRRTAPPVFSGTQQSVGLCVAARRLALRRQCQPPTATAAGCA